MLTQCPGLTVKPILKEYVPVCEIRVFGSRITGRIKKYPDLDLVIAGREKLNSKTMELLKETFEESDLSFRVEVLDCGKVSEDFKKIIEAKYEVIQKPLEFDLYRKNIQCRFYF